MDSFNKGDNPNGAKPRSDNLVSSVLGGLEAAIEIIRASWQKKDEEEYAQICRPIIKMEDCMSWLKVNREFYPQAKYFFITYERTAAPRNENDTFLVTFALADASKKPIPVSAKKRGGIFPRAFPNTQNQDVVCMVIPTGDLDTKILRALNGSSSVLITL